MKRIIIINFSCLLLFCSLTPDKHELHGSFNYLIQNPQTEENYTQRLSHLKRIDETSALCPHTLYYDYLKGLPVDYNQNESQVLWYLDTAVDHLLKGLENTNPLDDGVYLWHIYNMGYIIQYKNELIGIDINCRDAARFASHLTILLNTHKHADHYNNNLILAMEKMNRPFISNWYSNNYKTTRDTLFRFGSFKIKTTIGDHHYWSGNRNDMVMFEIEVNGVKIFHAGDNSNIGKMKNLENIDYFIAHHEVGFDYNDAITVIEPKHDIISHIMELGHSLASGWRWTYAHAHEKNVRRGTYQKGLLLSWGERLKLK